MEGVTAAGFKKFTSDTPIKGVTGDMQALYATHCFAVDGGTLTVQLAVVPKARLLVVLHFAEVFFEKPGLRTFDVNVNGVPQVQHRLSCSLRTHTLRLLFEAFSRFRICISMCLQLLGGHILPVCYATC